MKIIKDIKGGKLRLSKSRLTEVTGYQNQPFYLLLEDLKTDTSLYGFVLIRLISNNDYSLYVGVDSINCRIGCRYFSKKVFKQILKAAGVK